jgi:hypothetical protein
VNNRGSTAIACALVLSSCVGTTGGEVISFDAAASGPEDAISGSPLEFVTDRGWSVVLSKATLHVGAIYFNRSMPVSGVQQTSCILPDTYLAQVTSGIDVDLLSPDAQRFPSRGDGVTSPVAIAAQIWLTGERIDRQDDTTPILQVEGVARRDGDMRPFSGTITIGSNRLQTSGAGTPAGAAPICKQRIVSPIPVNVPLEKTGTLLLRIDPRLLFVNVDFGALPRAGEGFAFTDDATEKDQPSVNLYDNLRAARPSLYAFEWVP